VEALFWILKQLDNCEANKVGHCNDEVSVPVLQMCCFFTTSELFMRLMMSIFQ